jgi:hypothetical protein
VRPNPLRTDSETPQSLTPQRKAPTARIEVAEGATGTENGNEPDTDRWRFIDPADQDHGVKIAEARADEVRRRRERERAAEAAE